MSGKNWLERDPKDSPGLQRVTELYQTEKARRIAEKASHDAFQVQLGVENKQRAERASLVEDISARLLPTIEEIKDFANRTRTYPLGAVTESDLVVRVPQTGNVRVPLLDFPLKVVKIAETKVDKVLDNVDCPWAVIELSYGFQGSSPEYGYEMQGGEPTYVCVGSEEVVALYGIRAMIKTHGNKATVLIERQEVVTIPAHFGGWGNRGTKSPERKEVKVISVAVENLFDDKSIRNSFGEAFHNPVFLHYIRQEESPQPEPQASTGISGIVKGFLGLK